MISLNGKTTTYGIGGKMDYYICTDCEVVVMSEMKMLGTCQSCKEGTYEKLKIEDDDYTTYTSKSFHNFEGPVYHTTVSC